MKIKIVVLVIAALILIFGIFSYVRPAMVADLLFNRFNAYGLAARLYEIDYNRNKDVRSLEKLSISLYEAKHYEKASLYLGILIKDMAKLSHLDRFSRDRMIYRYMISLYRSGEREKFRNIYPTYIKNFEDELVQRIEFIRDIRKSNISQSEDYRFALAESEYIIANYKDIENDKLSVVYKNMADLYKKLGDLEKYQQYLEKAKEELYK